MKILFMGTPEFAREQLRALYENREKNHWEIVGAVSQPDKPKGRGYKLVPTPVKEYAEANGIPVFQPETLRNEAFLEPLKALAPDLIVVAAYGKILPSYVLDFPRYGCVNVHGSLLPAYRGAAPIQHCIMDGCRETGVTIMYMAEGLDTGDMIRTCSVEIGENEDFGSLYDRMAKAGAALLCETVPMLENGIAPRIPQTEDGVTYAHKIEKEECALDFTVPARTLHNKIRALSPAPFGVAMLTHDGKDMTVKLVSSTVEKPEGILGEAGTVLSLDDRHNRIVVACGEGAVAITALVPEGKGKMNAGDFIRGRKIAVGDIFHKKQERETTV